MYSKQRRFSKGKFQHNALSKTGANSFRHSGSGIWSKLISKSGILFYFRSNSGNYSRCKSIAY